MSRSVSAAVESGGASITLGFDACRMVLGGEFAGNIELDVACDTGSADVVLGRLRVRLPDAPPSDVAGVELAAGPRVGISRAAYRPLRFFDAESPDRKSVV